MSQHTKHNQAGEVEKYKVLGQVVPQLASGPRILTKDDEGHPAPDSGDVDEWKLTNMNGEIFLGLVGLKTIADADGADYLDDFCDLVVRSLKGINGFTAKQLERIAIGMSSGSGQKTVKKPGWTGRNITNRDWKDKADSEGAEVEE